MRLSEYRDGAAEKYPFFAGWVNQRTREFDEKEKSLMY